MSDDDGLESGQFLWILFLSLFLIIFSVTLSLLCHQACCFCGRYCIFEWKWCGCCCYFNRQEYQRERRHLQQLRELRQRREMELAHLATFSQIPGPIPDSFGFRELRRQSAIRDLTSLGFIVVTPSAAHHHHHHSAHGDVNSLQMRNQLTPQQRRDILDRILSSRTYHVHDLDAVQHGGEIKDTLHNNDIEEGNSAEPQTVQGPPPPIHSYAFPLHEEPEDPERTCAICLDTFAEGESINDTSKCPHVFHKACLMEWLDMHNVCPCCRCPMITDNEWRLAATSASSTLSSETTRIQFEQEPLREPVSEQPVVVGEQSDIPETVEEESNAAETIEQMQNDDGFTPAVTSNDDAPSSPVPVASS